MRPLPGIRIQPKRLRLVKCPLNLQKFNLFAVLLDGFAERLRLA
jgi:hypothetical protein